MSKIRVDVIGASLSGVSSAIAIKEHDNSIKVVIHEKNPILAFNPEGRRCGEGFCYFESLKRYKPIGKSIFNNIKKLEMVVDNKKYIYHQLPGVWFILNRQQYIYQLIKKAENLGVEIWAEDKIKSVNDLNGDYIVDGSGCPSIVKKDLNLKMGLISLGYQQTLEKSNHFLKDKLKLFFLGSTGYIWIFPRDPIKKEINLGIGSLINQKQNYKKILEKFKEEKNITGKINYSTGGFIPIGMQKPLKYDNILFVGDAGVGTSILGEGNIRAIYSGKIAGMCIGKDRVKKYPSLINQTFFKFDLAGTMFLKMHNFFQKIDDRLANLLIKKAININDNIRLLKLGEKPPIIKKMYKNEIELIIC